MRTVVSGQGAQGLERRRLADFGSIRFYSSRRDMLWNVQKTTKTGNVGFYLGKKQIISVSGNTEARRTFFETKDLHFNIW
jgi:hypothetical protein